MLEVGKRTVWDGLGSGVVLLLTAIKTGRMDKEEGLNGVKDLDKEEKGQQ